MEPIHILYKLSSDALRTITISCDGKISKEDTTPDELDVDLHIWYKSVHRGLYADFEDALIGLSGDEKLATLYRIVVDKFDREVEQSLQQHADEIQSIYDSITYHFKKLTPTEQQVCLEHLGVKL